MRMAHKEVSAKPGLRNMLPGRAKDFLNNPVAQSDSRPANPQNVSPKKASFEHVNPKHASLQPLPLPADPYSVFLSFCRDSPGHFQGETCRLKRKAC